ncbi:MAG: hypothetical protein GC193_06445 [Cryomorphaceae bacterium]|nr:hypothetical protein [Cryomorphaceae bacterium]
MTRWMYLALLLVLSCKKSDTTPPDVNLEIPSSALTAYNYGESIFIRFSANDETELSKYVVQLVDATRRIVASSGFNDLDGKEKSVTTSFNLVDRHLPSDDYSLEIIVEDRDGNRGIAFTTVRYYELPLQREALFIVSQTSNTTTIDSLSATGWMMAAALDVDAAVAFGGSYHQHVVVGGNSLPACFFYQVPEFLGVGGFSAQNPLSGQFVSDIVFDFERKSYIVSFFDGWIREFTGSGNIKNAFQVSPGFGPQKLHVADGELVCELVSPNGQSRVLSKYNINSGALLESSAISFDVVSFVQTSSNIYAIGNSGAESKVAVVFENMTNQIQDLLVESTQIFDIAELSNGWVALAHSNGVVLQKLGEAAFFPGSANNFSAIDLEYDTTTNTCFALSANSQLVSISPTGNIVSTIETGPNAQQVIVLLNK